MTSEPDAASFAPTETPAAQSAAPNRAPNTGRDTAPDAVTTTRPGAVRRATAQDAAEVAWLAAVTFPLACPPRSTRSEMATHIAQKLTVGQFRDWATSAEHTLLVYDDGTRLLGYALLALGTPQGAAESAVVREASLRAAPYVELSKIYVLPDAQGSGVASGLMQGASDAAAELGPGLPLWLATNTHNQRAQAFYRRSGFEVVGKRTYAVGGVTHDDLVFLHAR
ncbi:GNAT family N-acetyltransferase [Promicromonospora sp. Populi]|uniref:GNAT family N-acetyltransferase n=1 Tax=Promicromonospora sp. Populi TaxID=3239420 RepID=UPI0034E1F233